IPRHDQRAIRAAAPEAREARRSTRRTSRRAGHVSEELDIKSRGPTKGRNRYRTKRAGNNSEDQGEKPSEKGELNGCDKPLKEPGTGLAAPKDTPVEVIVHLRSRHWAMQNQPLVGTTGRSPLHGQEAPCSISAPPASAGIAWSRA